jgi:hypothetical protein
VEVLEDRVALTAFLVVNALDGPGNGPVGSLRYAIAQAETSGNPADRIVITPKVHGPIVLTAGEIPIGTSLSIENRASRPVEIRQTTPGARVFHVTNDPRTSQIFIGAASSVNQLIIDGGNVDGGNGGGVLVDNPDSVLSMTHVEIVGNSAVVAASSDPARSGGGGVYTRGRLLLDHSTVGTTDAPNQTSASGGGIWAGNGLTTRAATIQGNRAGVKGGGAYVAAGGASLADGSVIRDNQALNDGASAGGIYVLGGDVTVSRSRVDHNQAFNVGGIDAESGTVNVIGGSQVDDNSSTSTVMPQNGDFGGGGIAVKVGNVDLSHSEVSYNHSVGMYSSGIVILSGSVTVDAGSRVNWNRNNGPGGGIAANFGGTVTVTGHSQVDHNTGAAMGGGIVNFAGPNQAVVIEGGSEVKDNTLTNKESLGEALVVFLEYIASIIGGDFTTLTDGVSPDQARALIRQVEQEIATAHGLDPNSVAPGFVVAGGGIGTLQGAAVMVTGGSTVGGNLSGSRVDGGNPNSVGVGGAIATLLSPVIVDRSTVVGNTSSEDGGGIWNRLDVSISHSTVAGNTGLGETLGSLGGGLFLGSEGTATVSGSALKNNRSEFGGGVYNLGSLRLLGSLVTHNHASVSGGGIDNRGQLTISRSRIIANTPDNIASA